MKIFLLFAYFLLIAGCNNISVSKKIVISWENYTGIENPEQIRWLFNGKFVGKGHNGLLFILSEMENYPDGSLVYINKKPFEEAPSSWDYIAPFQKYIDNIEELLKKKKFKVKHLGCSEELSGDDGVILFLY